MKNINLSRILAFIAALIFIQTLYFKFSAHPDSVYIFSALGLEPYGRIGIGIAELITAGLLIYRRTMVLGAIAGIGIISGAISAHLFQLGIIVNGDGGVLFGLAVTIFLCCLIIVLRNKHLLTLDNVKRMFGTYSLA